MVYKSVLPKCHLSSLIWLAYFPTIWQFKALQCREFIRKNKRHCSAVKKTGNK